MCMRLPPPSHRQYDEYIASVQITTEFVDNKSNHQRVRYKFKPYVYTGIDEISIKGATLMPAAAQVCAAPSCMCCCACACFARWQPCHPFPHLVRVR